MKEHLSVSVMFAILIVSIGMAPVFGQTQSAIVVTTDKSSYSQGDVILVAGEVKDRYSGLQISVVMSDSNGNRVGLAQIEVDGDKKFSHEFRAGGLMRIAGTYTVEVQYGSVNNTAEASFEFDGVVIDDEKLVVMKESDPGVTDTTVAIEGTEDLITYEITNGRILSITPTESNSLVVSIETTGDGSITLTIPRTVLESTDSATDEDSEIFVLVDYEESNDYNITTTSTDRTITVEFAEGTEEIELIGTWVIPEFGTIAAMILAVAIISVIAISAKSKLSIIPRY